MFLVLPDSSTDNKFDPGGTGLEGVGVKADGVFEASILHPEAAEFRPQSTRIASSNRLVER